MLIVVLLALNPPHGRMGTCIPTEALGSDLKALVNVTVNVNEQPKPFARRLSADQLFTIYRQGNGLRSGHLQP